MRILLDSHAFVWFALGHERCSAPARDAIANAASDVFVSAASIWEIATKHRLGKWPEVDRLVANQNAILGHYRFEPLAITIDHARLAGRLPAAHKDPFDRMLAAQALAESLVLVTGDAAFRHFDVATLW